MPTRGIPPRVSVISLLKKRIRRFSIANLAVMVCLVLNGCASMQTTQIPDYPGRPVQNYSNYKTRDGLAVAVYPMTDKKEMEKYFGVDLLSRKILAVFVKVKNMNSTASYLLQKENVRATNNSTTVSNKIGSTSSENGLGVVSFVGALAAPIILLPAAIPLAMAGGKMDSNVSAIRYNLAIKELQTHTISPGKSMSGFLYVHVSDQFRKSGNLVVKVTADRLMTKKKVDFIFPIHISKENLQ